MLLGLKFGLLDALLELLLSLPYSRLMEQEADILGLDNMVAACIPLAAAAGLWKRMAAEAARKDRLKERAEGPAQGESLGSTYTRLYRACHGPSLPRPQLLS